MIKRIIAQIKESFDLRRDKEFFHRIKETIEAGVYFRGVNLYILIFAILICSLGLDINSTAVIIGAMLISPLMGPIIGLGFALGTTNWGLFLKAGKNYLIATGIALITSTIYFLLSPLNLEQSELLIRTTPTIYDVLIAFFGGFAGIIATASKQKGNVIPGVAIATALMPPLCTAGFGLAEMNTTYLFGALYLYIINTVFIGMATFLACRLLKLPARQTENIKKAERIAAGIAILTFLPAVFLGINLYQKTRFSNNANTFIEEACYLEDHYLFSKNIDAVNKTIELVYGGGVIPDSMVEQLLAKKDAYHLKKANIKIVESFSKPISDINKGLKSMHNKMDEKDIKIQKLTAQFDSFKQQYIIDQTSLSLLNNFKKIEAVEISEASNPNEYLLKIKLKQAEQKGRRKKANKIILNGQDSIDIIKSAKSRLNASGILLEIISSANP